VMRVEMRVHTLTHEEHKEHGIVTRFLSNVAKCFHGGGLTVTNRFAGWMDGLFCWMNGWIVLLDEWMDCFAG